MKPVFFGSARTWIITAFVISALTGVATWSLKEGTAATGKNPILGLKITPDPASVEAGGTLRLTAEGDYGTTSMPVRADWFFLEPESEATGTLDGCERSKTCDFRAGDIAGIAVIQAQIGDGEAVARAKIIVKEALKNPFKDVLPSWAQASILRLHKQDIVKGYDDGRYGPADSLTRGQIVTLIVRMLMQTGMLKAGETCARSPVDVPSKHYAYDSVCAFGNRGWIEPKGSFRPDATVSRAETAGFLASAIGSILEKDGASETIQVFEDIPVSSSFFRPTSLLQRAGIMTGYPGGDFGALDPLNRAAAATVVDRALGIVQNAGPVPPIPLLPSAQTKPAAKSAAPATGLKPALPLRDAFQASPGLPLPRSGDSSCQKSKAPSAETSLPESASDTFESALPESAGDTFPVNCCEACPASDADRFYIPFGGNTCFAGDVRRDDLKGNACGNPLLENTDNLPVTYGSRCLSRPQTTGTQLNTRTDDAPVNHPAGNGANAGGVQDRGVAGGAANAGGVLAGAAGNAGNAGAGNAQNAPVNGSYDTSPDAPRIDCSGFEARYRQAAERYRKAKAALDRESQTENEDSIKARGQAMEKTLDDLEKEIRAAEQDFGKLRQTYADNDLLDAEGYPLMWKDGVKVRSDKLSPLVDRIRQLKAKLETMLKEYYALVDAFSALVSEHDAAYAELTARYRELEACKDARDKQSDAISAKEKIKSDKKYKEWEAGKKKEAAAQDAREKRGEIPPGLGSSQECCVDYTRAFVDTCYRVTLDTTVGVSTTFERGNYWDQDAFDAWRQWMQAVDWASLLTDGIGGVGERIAMVAEYVAGLFGIESSPSYLSKDVVLDLLQKLVDRMPNMVMEIVVPVRVKTHTKTDVWTARANGICAEIPWSHKTNVSDTYRTVYMRYECISDKGRYSFDFGVNGCYPKTSEEWVDTIEKLVKRAIDEVHEEETDSGPICPE